MKLLAAIPRVHYIPIFAALCAFVALVLSVLCVLAGSKSSMLPDYYIVSLNTSNIGLSVFDAPAAAPTSSPVNTSSPGSLVGSLFHNATAELDDELDAAEHSLEAHLDGALSTLAHALGLHDFYALHVLGFCEGFFAPNSSRAAATNCSAPRPFFAWSPAATLAAELDAAANATGVNVTLAQLQWPSAVDEALDALRDGLHVMYVLYCLGIAATALALLGSIVGVFFTGRRPALANIALAGLAFLALLVASGIVTDAASSAAGAVNEWGADVGISASRGDKLVAMTWAADILMFVAALAWCAEFWVGRKMQSLIPKQLQ